MPVNGLLVGALTTLATSDIDDWERSDELALSAIEIGEPVHVTARFSEVAYQRANGLFARAMPEMRRPDATGP